MRGCGNRGGAAGVGSWALGLVLGLALTGCNKPEEPVGGTTQVIPRTEVKAEQLPPAAIPPRLKQPFADATYPDPPPGWFPPPPTTMTGQSVGKLYEQVVSLWDTITFVAPSGKRLTYRATLVTEYGNIEITLLPDLAPNHVRSFLALAQAGYFDGLVFERTAHEEGQDGKLELIEAGCPLGTGEIGYGSIGYWLKPEFSSEVSHEEGTVGAFHYQDSDASACKFYITLCPAPEMDGQYTIFGKVTQGLDVARQILALPVRTDSPEGDRPKKPVVIQKVTIQSEG